MHGSASQSFHGTGSLQLVANFNGHKIQDTDLGIKGEKAQLLGPLCSQKIIHCATEVKIQYLARHIKILDKSLVIMAVMNLI